MSAVVAPWPAQSFGALSKANYVVIELLTASGSCTVLNRAAIGKTLLK